MNIVNAIRFAIILTITSFLASPAMALRCDNRIVSEGLTLAEVHKYCGIPVFTQERKVIIETALRSSSKPGVKHRSNRALSFEERVFEEVQVDEWTYNFGPRRFMSLIRFINGRVSEVENLGYGYHD